MVVREYLELVNGIRGGFLPGKENEVRWFGLLKGICPSIEGIQSSTIYAPDVKIEEDSLKVSRVFVNHSGRKTILTQDVGLDESICNYSNLPEEEILRKTAEVMRNLPDFEANVNSHYAVARFEYDADQLGGRKL